MPTTDRPPETESLDDRRAPADGASPSPGKIMAHPTDTALKDIPEARGLLQAAKDAAGATEQLADALASIDAMIRVARRLNHPRLPDDPTRSAAAAKEV